MTDRLGKSRSGIKGAVLREIATRELQRSGLRRGTSVALLDIPLHGNIGDSLITLGEFQILSSMGVRIAHCGSRQDPLELTARRVSKRTSTVLLHGGGNLGDLWPISHQYRLRATEVLSAKADIIWLPQSVYFQDEDGPLVRETREVVSKYAPRVLLRDEQSVDVWGSLIGGEATLFPDMGLLAEVPTVLTEPGDSILLSRRDKESNSNCIQPNGVDWSDAPKPSGLSEAMRLATRKLVAMSPSSLVRKAPFERAAFHHLASHRVNRGLELFDKAETVETDRLHAAILALLSGRRTIVGENSYGKLRAVLGTWSEYIDSERIEFPRS